MFYYFISAFMSQDKVDSPRSNFFEGKAYPVAPFSFACIPVADSSEAARYIKEHPSIDFAPFNDVGIAVGRSQDGLHSVEICLPMQRRVVATGDIGFALVAGDPSTAKSTTSL